MCEPGKPCPETDMKADDALPLVIAMAEMGLDPVGIDFIVVGPQIGLENRFATMIQGDKEIIEKMIISVLKSYVKRFGTDTSGILGHIKRAKEEAQ